MCLFNKNACTRTTYVHIYIAQGVGTHCAAVEYCTVYCYPLPVRVASRARPARRESPASRPSLVRRSRVTRLTLMRRIFPRDRQYKRNTIAVIPPRTDDVSFPRNVQTFSVTVELFRPALVRYARVIRSSRARAFRKPIQQRCRIVPHLARANGYPVSGVTAVRRARFTNTYFSGPSTGKRSRSTTRRRAMSAQRSVESP